MTFGLSFADYLVDILLHFCRRNAAEHVVGTELDDHDLCVVLIKDPIGRSRPPVLVSPETPALTTS